LQKKLLEAEITNIDTGGLEPLLEEILKLFDTSDQLSRGIKKIFHNIDYDRAGFFGYRKLAEGLRKLNTHKPILLTEADFEVRYIDGSCRGPRNQPRPGRQARPLIDALL
jgi:hypothetical protein